MIESKTLKELLHKSEMEKFDLLHKMEDLEEQNKRLQVFQKQINSTDQKIMDFIAKTKMWVSVWWKLKSLKDNFQGNSCFRNGNKQQG